jgi:C-terminal peptidase prc
MNPKLRIIAWFPVLIALLACSTYIPILQQKPAYLLAQKSFTGKASTTPLPTSTPSPTATYTPTPLPPSITPTQIPTSTEKPTDIPLNTQLSIFDDLWTIVNDTYIYPDFNGLDWNTIYQEYRQKISAGMTNGQFYQSMSDLITSLGDDHSFFLDPQLVAEQEAEYQGEYDYVGIGVLVSAVPERDRAVIISVFPGSPAEVAGLRTRDSILSVDGTPILDEYGFLRDIVRGPEGTAINITVQTPGEDPRVVQITRHRINGEVPVVYEVITTPEGKRIGYILLVTFEDSTVDEQAAEALRQMTVDGPLDGLILDNRMNGGGSSTVLEPMLGFFAGGDLGTFFSRDQEHPLQIRLNNINGSSLVPLVVLVGNGTASFGEIFAGVLQDIDRAYLIGTTTEGNVEILWGYELEDGSKLWLANENFRPLNHPEQEWEKTGIIPDLNIPGDFDEFSLNNDPAVAAAIEYLSER